MIILALPACRDDAAIADAEAERAQVLLEQDRLAEARIAINGAISAQDDIPDYYIKRGRIEFAAGSPEAAFDAYYDAIALDPSNFEALQAVSQLGLQIGRIRESLAATEALLALSPEDETALLTRGLHYYVRSKFEDAEDLADRILELNPINESGVILKSRVLFESDRREEALLLLSTLDDVYPNSAGIALTRLELFRANRNGPGMRQQFAILRQEMPQRVDLRLDEANLLFKTGRSQAALGLTVDAIVEGGANLDVAGDVIKLWNEFSATEFTSEQIGRIGDAAAPSARSMVAEYLALARKAEAARRLAATLPQIEETSILSQNAMYSGDLGTASAMAGSILAQEESHCRALTVRSWTSLRGRKPRAALSDAQQAASQCPEDRFAWTMIATSYDALGDTTNAYRAWQQGSDELPQDSVYTANFVQWLLERGRGRQALAVSRRLTRAAPALLSGWQLYLQTCVTTGNPCANEAQRGLSEARSMYWIDFEPGERPPEGLFGRIERI